MQVVDTVPERAEIALVATAEALWSATPRLLTRWSTASGLRIVDTVSRDEPRPGPLMDLAAPGEVGWGPTIIPTRTGGRERSVTELIEAAITDVGQEAIRWYQLEVGAVSADGSRAALVVAKQRSRARSDRARTPPGPPSRTAVIHLDDDLAAEVVDEGQRPTSLAWAGDSLVLGLPGVAIWSAGSVTVVDPDDRSYPAALAVSPDGPTAAGTADGRIVVFDPASASLDRAWIGHDRVRALAWHPSAGRLVSGGGDGAIRVWDDGDEVDRYDADGEVVALACSRTGEVIAKLGGVDGRIMMLA